MISLNGKEYEYMPRITLSELVDRHNRDVHPKLGFDGFVVVVSGAALTVAQAQERLLADGDEIFIVPILDGG
jgi:sulfur carrier protein ThiS